MITAHHSLRNILTNEMTMKECSKHSDQKGSVGPGSSIHDKIIIVINILYSILCSTDSSTIMIMIRVIFLNKRGDRYTLVCSRRSWFIQP